MKQHRDNLLKLIKMMEAIKTQEKINNEAMGRLDEELDLYIRDESLISLRELTRMFIEELNSECMECKKDDEIVKFIKSTILWFDNIYDNIIESNLTNSIKRLKICGQLNKDYEKVYNDAKTEFGKVVQIEPLKISYEDGFNFGRNKAIKETYTNNSIQQPITINLSINGENIDANKIAEELANALNENLNRSKHK